MVGINTGVFVKPEAGNVLLKNFSAVTIVILIEIKTRSFRNENSESYYRDKYAAVRIRGGGDGLPAFDNAAFQAVLSRLKTELKYQGLDEFILMCRIAGRAEAGISTGAAMKPASERHGDDAAGY